MLLQLGIDLCGDLSGDCKEAVLLNLTKIGTQRSVNQAITLPDFRLSLMLANGNAEPAFNRDGCVALRIPHGDPEWREVNGNARPSLYQSAIGSIVISY